MAIRPYDQTVAIVTGAGRGIGRATAELLGAGGAKVALVSRSHKELQDVQRAITEKGGEALVLAGDICEQGFIIEAVERTALQWNSPNCLINNAGTFLSSPVWQHATEDWEYVMNVNARAAFLFAREVFSRLVQAKQKGLIINVASIAGVRGVDKFPGMSSYIMSKYAMVGLTDALALEGRPFGIRANCVAPGSVDTKLLRDAAPDLKTNLKAEDVAGTIVSLCEQRSSHLSGALIEVRPTEEKMEG